MKQSTARRLCLLACLTVLPGFAVTMGCQHHTSASGVDQHRLMPIETGSVIFIHPDGAGPNQWGATRMLHVGPDGDLNWDKLPAIALYRGHLADNLTGTSNAGATIHATGVKVDHDAFGRSRGGPTGTPLVNAQGENLSVARQALARGLPVGLVQTGIAPEPGTACFVTDVKLRNEYDEITRQLVESGVAVHFSGGERFFLPEGVEGRFGPGSRKDNLNLIDRAKALDYTIVYTRDELKDLMSSRTPGKPIKVLGIFAREHTFNDQSEETLREQGLPLFVPTAPDVGEMTEAALSILSDYDKRFLLVVEEEGSDNFGNKNNAAGVMESLRRADRAMGVALDYIEKNPKTLVMTTADSDAGGMQVYGYDLREDAKPVEKVPDRDANGGPVDGIDGASTAPFVAAPDRAGKRLPFGIVWASRDDVAGGILVRGAGLNSQHVRGSFDNTKIAELIRATLIGE